jgi:hypothetical protein
VIKKKGFMASDLHQNSKGLELQTKICFKRLNVGGVGAAGRDEVNHEKPISEIFLCKKKFQKMIFRNKYAIIDFQYLLPIRYIIFSLVI